ncbi:MAG: hypothetical protein AAFU66_00580 [Pseudomonadota bacterium]
MSSTTIEVKIDDEFLERLEDRSLDAAGGNMLVDAVAVNVLVDAYRERQRLRKDADDLKQGRCVVTPCNLEHAQHMKSVAENFIQAADAA